MGCNLSVHRSGTGETLMWLHGAGGAPSWAPFMGKLAESFDTIVPEHPGFGHSSKPDWLDNLQDLAYFYLDFIAANKLENIHLVGTSLGGWLACEIAIRDSSAIKSLTLVAPAGIHVQGVPTPDTFLWTPEEQVRNAFSNQAIADAALARVPTEAEVEMKLRNALTVALLAWKPRFYNPHLSKWLHRIDVPTHLIWGEDDKIIPYAYADAFKSLIPHLEFTSIPECGHLPHAEKPDVYVKAIGDFIRSI